MLKMRQQLLRLGDAEVNHKVLYTQRSKTDN